VTYRKLDIDEMPVHIIEFPAGEAQTTFVMVLVNINLNNETTPKPGHYLFINY